MGPTQAPGAALALNAGTGTLDLGPRGRDPSVEIQDPGPVKFSSTQLLALTLKAPAPALHLDLDPQRLTQSEVALGDAVQDDLLDLVPGREIRR